MKQLLLSFSCLLIVNLSFGQMVQTTNTSPGACDGSAVFTEASGYTFQDWSWYWTQDSTTVIQTGGDSIDSLCGGYYLFHLDSAGIELYSESFTVFDPCSTLTYSLAYGNTDPNACTGFATITGAGGTAPYAYIWSNGVTTPTITDLCIGVYQFSVVDANGCMINGNVAITVDSAGANLVLANLAIVNDDAGDCTGSAAVSPAGGTAPYTILWSNGDNGPATDSLCAGIYSVVIIDANSDTLTTPFVITDPNSTYGNDPYGDSLVVDTLYTYLVENCTIDYANIDSAALYQATLDSVSQNLIVTWAIYSPNGTITYIDDTLGIPGQTGVYTLVIQVFCPQKSTGTYFAIVGQVYIDGNQAWVAALEENELDAAVVSPNPFTDVLNVSLPATGDYRLTVRDAAGRTILSEELEQVQQVTLHPQALASGAYFLEIASGQAVKVVKLVH